MGNRQRLRDLPPRLNGAAAMATLEPVEKAYWLAKLCEANFERLLRLIPGLRGMDASATARAEGKPALHLQLLDHAPYTLTLELSHCFGSTEPLLEPAVRIRVYLDARAAEVLSDHARANVYSRPPQDVLDYKWRLNYFLSQWLDHCLAAQYCFGLATAERSGGF